jgi:tetratricopeptide (TPR) repeat protein
MLGLALPAVAAEPKTADEYIARAFRRIDTWQWPEALADAGAALRLEPDSARAMLARGAANVGINPAAALRDLAAAEKLGERSARLYCERGLAYCALKRHDKALEAAEGALKIDPKESRAYALRGKALTARKGLRAALDDLDKAIALDPSLAYGYGLRGEVIAEWDVHLGAPPPDLLRLKQLNPHYPEELLPLIMAMPYLRGAIQRDPANPRYYCDRGRAYYRLNRGQEALHDLDHAVALNPNFLLAYFYRMEARTFLRDYRAADADAVRMIELDPSGYGGHHAHGWYLYMTGERVESLKQLDLAIQADPQHAAKDYLARAVARLEQQKYSEVVADASRVIEINPRQADAHYLRAEAFLQLRELRKALADFDFMVRIAPEDANYWTWRGQVKMFMSDYAGAVEDYDRALRCSRRFPVAALQRGICRAELGDFAGAASDYRDALDQGVERDRFEGNCPGHAVAHRGLGEIFLKQDKCPEALAQFDQALEIYPRDACSLIDRGMVKRRLGDCRGALLDLLRAVAVNPRDYRGYSEQGYCRCALRDYGKALAAFDAAARVCPPAASPYAGRGMLKLALDDCEGALVDLDVAVRQAYRAPGAAPDRQARSGEVEEMAAGDADNPFDFLVGEDSRAGASREGKPDRRLLGEIHENRGRAFYEMAQFARAVKECDQAFRLWPPSEEGLMTRSTAKGRLGDRQGWLADADKALAINPKCQWAGCDRAIGASLDGDFAGALAILNRLVQDDRGASAPRLDRGVLLDVLHEPELALADYREALKDTGGSISRNADQAALAIWTVCSLQAQRAATDQELRRHFEGRKPDLKNNWYGRLASFLLNPADTEAALLRDARTADRSRAPWRQTAACYYLGVRRRMAGDESGTMEMMKKAAATNAVAELQWYESELRLRIASGKISSPQQPEAGQWRENLPRPAKSASDR